MAVDGVAVRTIEQILNAGRLVKMSNAPADVRGVRVTVDANEHNFIWFITWTENREVFMFLSEPHVVVSVISIKEEKGQYLVRLRPATLCDL